MTDRQIFEFYLISTAAAIAAWYIFRHPAAPIFGFITASAIQTHQAQTKKRP